MAVRTTGCGSSSGGKEMSEPTEDAGWIGEQELVGGNSGSQANPAGDKRFETRAGRWCILATHTGATGLSDIILGARTGGRVLGVVSVAATGHASCWWQAWRRPCRSVSMGAVAYTSTLADADVFESERSREYRHIERHPHLERAEIREIYKRKGFGDDLLDQIVETITANPDVWVAVMMAEEHQLGPVDRRVALRAAWVVGQRRSSAPHPSGAFSSPVVRASSCRSWQLPWCFWRRRCRGRLTVSRPVRGLEMAAIRTINDGGVAIGALLAMPPTP
jgi:hypothetical protein